MSLVEKNNTIKLPSFLRRTLKAYALKSQIRELGGELNRVGRSRNWLLTANFNQIQAIITFIEQENEPSWLWLSTLLKAQFQELSHDNLISFAQRLEQLTVTSLMAHTDCTLAQARKVIDELEGID